MKLCPDCNNLNQNDVNYCSNCGHKFADSTDEQRDNVAEKGNAICPKCKSKNIAKEESGYVCNECGHEFDTLQTSVFVEFINEIKRLTSRFISFFKSIDSSNFKSKLLNVKMAIRYIFVLAIILAFIAAYNAGKSVVVSDELLKSKSKYQSLVEEYNVAQKDLPKLKAEITSNSDLLDELKDYKQSRDKKLSEISRLSSEKSSLESDVESLKIEKDKLTKEIAKAKGKGYKLSAGRYVGGKDIPVGTYNITWTSGNGYVTVGDQVHEVFANETYAIKSYKNCDVDYGTTIEISGTVKVQFKSKE